MLARSRSALRLEALEARECPATHVFDAAGNITIFLASTDLTLDIDVVATNTIDYTAGGGPTISGLIVNNINVIGTSSSEDVTLDLGGDALAGSFNFDGGLGVDTFDNDGTAGTLGGNLALTRVNTITLLNLGTIVGGNVTVNNLNENTPATMLVDSQIIGGLVTYAGGNVNDTLDIATTQIGTNLTYNTGNGLANTLSLQDVFLGSNLFMTGGNGDETVTADTVSVGGSATFNLASALNSNQITTFTNSNVGMNFNFTGGVRDDQLQDISGTTIERSTYFNLGSGANLVDMTDVIFGNSYGSFTYYGGVGVDTITFVPGVGSARVRFTAYLGAGIDTVTFGAGAAAARNPSYAYIDFGAGADVVTGTLNFPFTFLNLP